MALAASVQVRFMSVSPSPGADKTRVFRRAYAGLNVSGPRQLGELRDSLPPPNCRDLSPASSVLRNNSKSLLIDSAALEDLPALEIRPYTACDAQPHLLPSEFRLKLNRTCITEEAV